MRSTKLVLATSDESEMLLAAPTWRWMHAEEMGISLRKSNEATASRSFSPYRTKNSPPRPMIEGLAEPQLEGRRSTLWADAAINQAHPIYFYISFFSILSLFFQSLSFKLLFFYTYIFYKSWQVNNLIVSYFYNNLLL